MNLIPLPRIILCKKGFCDLGRTAGEIAINAPSGEEAVDSAVEKIRECFSGRGLRTVPSGHVGVITLTLSFSAGDRTAEAYSLNIDRDGITISGAGPVGVFWGAITLLQLLREHGTVLPCLAIEDRPDYPKRGFLHDVTRGKVPTLATLKLLVDRLAYYKVNQLQLYIEHSFAFKHIPELWQGRGPLTADEIRELDTYCGKNCIELVPCLATFGHLYELLRIPRLEHLNELDIKASRLPHSLWDRMAHYTIDASSEEAFLLIKSMIDEFVDLFRSEHCNICCDETFDLGQGKNRQLAAEKGAGRLYINFVKKLAEVVSGHGKIPMIWGDVVLRYPDLIRELPRETVFLNWDYAAEATDCAVKVFSASGVKQYVCPGVQGWSRFAYDIGAAAGNIRKMTRYGLENSAAGILNTDWGDCGHVNFLAGSFHGMALGAALAWNGGSYHEDWQFDSSFSALEWNDESGALIKYLRELGSLCFYHFGNMYAWVNGIRGKWDREGDVRKADYQDIIRSHARASAIKESIEIYKKNHVSGGDSRDLDEHIWSAAAIRWTLALLVFKKRCEYGQGGCSPAFSRKNELLRDGQSLLAGFQSLWLGRNKESELCNVTGTFTKIFSRIESVGDEKD